jgi:Ca-activated chloride channel family protein
MKRQIILLFILLLVTTLFSACTTSTTSETVAVELQNKHPNQPEPKIPVAKKPGAGREDDKLLSKQSVEIVIKNQHRQGAEEKNKSESAVATLQEAEATAGSAAAVSPQTFATGDSSRLMRMVAPSGIAPNVPAAIRWPSEPLDRENYAEFKENPVMLVAEHPVSTFSIDVDTGSYTNTRRILREGRLPAKNVVRVEEFINYFNYDYPAPESGATPFNVITEVGPTPWNVKTNLLHIGIKGYEVAATALPAANLVFLVDVSGSMHSQNKLPLLKKSLQLLTQKLRAQDRVSLVVYAGASGTVLEPTSGADKAVILEALESLSAGGSTNGAAGIRLAYLKAQQAYIPDGVNRVILATDGDFNVGTTNFDALKSLAEEKRKSGIFLTTLGFGSGNYNDKLMEQLADVGNGNYAYVDSLMEAQKVLVTEMGSTLNTIAKDVKIQIEFNPAVVTEYRLVGYENRALRREDFNNDKIDAGEIGAGHTVTAIYEIALVNQGGNLIDPLRYQSGDRKKFKAKLSTQELAFLRLRYKHPESEQSILMETPVQKNLIVTDMAKMSKRYQFSASVAGFAQLLRGGQFTQQYTYSDVASMAVASKGIDRYGYRGEFVRLVELANTLSGNARAPVQEKALN